MSIGVTLGGVALVAGGAWLMDATADLDTPGGAETPLWFYGTTALGGLAMIAGPSAGHAYAGEWGHALLFTGLRTGALLLAATGLAETDCAESCSGLGDGAALALGLGGLAASVGLAVYDIWDSARAARRYNTRVLAEAGLTASVVPTYDPHRRAGGLALAGSF
jgi:hypothetical protein